MSLGAINDVTGYQNQVYKSIQKAKDDALQAGQQFGSAQAQGVQEKVQKEIYDR